MYRQAIGAELQEDARDSGMHNVLHKAHFMSGGKSEGVWNVRRFKVRATCLVLFGWLGMHLASQECQVDIDRRLMIVSVKSSGSDASHLNVVFTCEHKRKWPCQASSANIPHQLSIIDILARSVHLLLVDSGI